MAMHCASRRCALVGCLSVLGCGAGLRDPGDRAGLDDSFSVTRIADQSGAVFDWVCDDDETCAVVPVAGGSPGAPPCEGSIDGGGDGFYFTALWGRFVQVTAMCEVDDPLGSLRGIGEGAWRRIVMCDDDGDCPQPLHLAAADLEHDPGEYVCHLGYCQADNVDDYPRDVLTAREAPTLCFGTQPRYADPLGTTEARAAVEAACPRDGDGWDAPCGGSLPEVCPDPR